MAKVDFSIVAIARRENRYVEEWLNYHFGIGFNRIYLYDNPGPGDADLSFLKESYEGRLVLTHIAGEGRQSGAYKHFIDNFKQETEWVAFLDLDEFIVLNEDKTVPRFIGRYGHIGSIAISWLMFGHSGHHTRPNGLILDNYTWRYPFCFSQIKTLCRVGCVDNIVSIHNVNGKAVLINGFDLKGLDRIPPHSNLCDYNRALDTTSVLSIHHYFSRSLEDVDHKIARGSAAGTVGRNLDWFLNKKEVFGSTIDLTLPKFIRSGKSWLQKDAYIYFENRIEQDGQTFSHVIPGDWDGEWYHGFYPDLRDRTFDQESMKEHFRTKGAFEGRCWNQKTWNERFFDPRVYLGLHEDLKTAGYDAEAAMAHYFLSGRFEGRQIF